MATQILDRHTYMKTRHRGFAFRYQADGSKRFVGYVPGRGRVLLESRTEREALAAWNELRGKAGNGETIPKRNVKLRDIEPQWWELKQRKLRSSTITEYRAALDLVHLPLFGHRLLNTIDADALSKLQLGLADRGLNYVDHKRPVRPLSAAQVSNYMKPLRGLMAYAARHKKIAVNPFDLLTADDRSVDDSARIVHEWSDEEIEKVLTKAEELDRRPEARQEYTPLIASAIETGARLGELTGSEWGTDGLDLSAGVWNVRQQWTKAGELVDYTKTPSGIRRIPLTPEFVRRMKAYRLRSQFSQDGDPVFATMGRGGSRRGGGGRLSHRNVQRRAWEPIKDALALPDKVTFHQLRHAFASRAHARGVELQDLSMVMGHSSPAVTARIYVHLYGREKAEERFRTAMMGAAAAR
jgi:integrase